MNEVFLEITVDRSVFTSLKEYKFPVPVFEKHEISTIIFDTEDDYCKCLKDIEKVSTKYLSEYWLFKTTELVKKNKCINRVLTILNEARAKKYPEFERW